MPINPEPGRRHFLRSAVAGSILMPALIDELIAADVAKPARGGDPLAPRPPHQQASVADGTRSPCAREPETFPDPDNFRGRGSI